MQIPSVVLPHAGDELVRQAERTGDIATKAVELKAANERSQFMNLVRFIDGLPGDKQQKWFKVYGSSPRLQELSQKYLGTQFVPTKLTSEEETAGVNASALAKDVFLSDASSALGPKGIPLTGLEARMRQIPVTVPRGGGININTGGLSPSQVLADTDINQVLNRYDAAMSTATDKNKPRIMQSVDLEMSEKGPEAIQDYIKLLARNSIKQGGTDKTYAQLQELYNIVSSPLAKYSPEERTRARMALAEYFSEARAANDIGVKRPYRVGQYLYGNDGFYDRMIKRQSED